MGMEKDKKIRLKNADKNKLRCSFSFEKNLDAINGINNILELLGFTEVPEHNIKDLIYDARRSRFEIGDAEDEVYGMENNDYFVNVFIGNKKAVLVINSREDRQKKIGEAVFEFADFGGEDGD